MRISQLIAPHLRCLRRFARALSGSQHRGDAYVAALLETIIADPSSFSQDLDPRVALYRQFLKMWNSIGAKTAYKLETMPEAEAAASRTLYALMPRTRQAFLLLSVERFTAKQTALILDTDIKEVAKLAAQAGREIAEQVATDVLIIEDEPLIAMDLTDVAESLGHRVVGRARTHKEAIRTVNRHTPGLVLADIKLADGSSGLDAVNEILDSVMMPVVFITSYPERLLTGERPEPTFLITKPFANDMVKAVVSQALFFGSRPRNRGETLPIA